MLQGEVRVGDIKDSAYKASMNKLRSVASDICSTSCHLTRRFEPALVEPNSSTKHIGAMKDVDDNTPVIDSVVGITAMLTEALKILNELDEKSIFY